MRVSATSPTTRLFLIATLAFSIFSSGCQNTPVTNTGNTNTTNTATTNTNTTTMAVDPGTVLEQARACGAAGVRALVVLSGGFQDSGEPVCLADVERVNDLDDRAGDVRDDRKPPRLQERARQERPEEETANLLG